jgi:DNA-binding CsgD family transcriptional regulator
MAQGLKEKIFDLRGQGYSYNEITDKLKCSKSSVAYHCGKLGIANIGLQKNKLLNKEIEKVKEFYILHSLKETIKKFNISASTVKRYAKKEKRELLTEVEKRGRNYERVKTHRQKIKSKSVQYKGGKCEKCGYNKCEWAFDFHHLDKAKKDFSIAQYSTVSWEKIKKELDKCIMVCANCHREIHYEEHLNK